MSPLKKISVTGVAFIIAIILTQVPGFPGSAQATFYSEAARKFFAVEKERIDLAILYLKADENTFSLNEEGRRIATIVGNDAVRTARTESTFGDTIRRIGFEIYGTLLFFLIFIFTYPFIVVLIACWVLCGIWRGMRQIMLRRLAARQ